MTVTFSPTRHAGLERLAAFVPQAGRAYAAERNYDRAPQGHPDVSRLSPYVRHRAVTEAEVLTAVLGRHSPRGAEKFVQEVFWRTYWKGWLEMRPGVWTAYRTGVARALDRIDTEAGLRADWEAACLGRTGIDAFDSWASELAETGYLHNHARMWFASIWVFTLRLPWELGADFFLRHLLDGDPASNTLGWRWVAGLQTPGKVYAAQPANIAKYTDGRFRPAGLAAHPVALDGPPAPERAPLPLPERLDPARPTGWLLTEEDLSPDFALPRAPVPMALLDHTAGRSPLHVAPMVTSFVRALVQDAAARHADRVDDVTPLEEAGELIGWARAHGLTQIGTAYIPVGPAADAIARLRPALDAEGVRLVQVRRDYDSAAWPHATHGFFRFKEKIPKLLQEMALPKAA